MVGHWDEAPWTAREHGEIRCERQRLSGPRGGSGATLSRYRIPAGARSTPVHVHVDEEELFVVLDGSGLSWQADAVHEVAAGDVLLHRADGEPHALIGAGAGPLEVLAYASGSPTGLTLLPRAGVAWVGSRWLPTDAPHPYDAEPALGELPPTTPRPPTIVALADVAPTVQERGPVHRTRRNLGNATGSRLSGLQHVTVAPGGRSSVRHCHSLEDELFVVLEGDGELLLGDARHAVRPGSVVSRPCGTGVAHAFEAGPDGLVLLSYGTREIGDVVWYPDSRKVSFAGVGVIARVEPLDYWDGEA